MLITVGFIVIFISLVSAITLMITGCNPDIEGTCVLYDSRIGSVIAYGAECSLVSCTGSVIAEFNNKMCTIDVHNFYGTSYNTDYVLKWLHKNYPNGYQLSFYQRNTDNLCYLSNYLCILTNVGIACFSLATFLIISIIIYVFFRKNYN